MANGINLLTIRNLNIYFSHQDTVIKAVDNLYLDIHEYEVLGLDGESGSGKTISALAITKLLPRGARIISGQIIFEDKDLLKMSEEKLREIRGSKIAYIFQDPVSSLNPVFTVGQQLTEVILFHQGKTKHQADKEATRLLKLVKMPKPDEILSSYPHQLSGGMNQRAMIAMALANNARLLIADEPTTALDVTIEAQIIELLEDLKSKFNLSILMITHDLGLVRRFADRVSIMYQGTIVESANIDEIFNNPKHPHTKALIEAVA